MGFHSKNGLAVAQIFLHDLQKVIFNFLTSTLLPVQYDF